MQWLRHIRDKNPLPTCGSRCSPGTASPRLLSLPALPAEERGQRPGKQPGTGVTLWAARPHCHGEQLPPEPGLGLCPPPSSCSPAGAHPGSGDEGHPCPPPFVPANTAWPPGWWQQQGQGSACGRALSKPWASVNSFRHVAEGSSIPQTGTTHLLGLGPDGRLLHNMVLDLPVCSCECPSRRSLRHGRDPQLGSPFPGSVCSGNREHRVCSSQLFSSPAERRGDVGFRSRI